MPYQLPTLQELIENFEKIWQRNFQKFRMVPAKCLFQCKRPIPEQTVMRLMLCTDLLNICQNK